MGMSKFNLYRNVRTPKGWRYCKVVYSVTVHDAVLIEAPVGQIDADAEAAKRCWAQASEIVLGGSALDADSKVVRYPDVCHDEDGEEMWNRLLGVLAGP
jgi:hypothetical protein